MKADTNMKLLKKYFVSPCMGAILGIGLIFFAQESSYPFFGSSPVILLYLVIITFAAWHQGIGAGLLTTFISAIASVLDLFPLNSNTGDFHPDWILAIGLSISVGAFFSMIVYFLYRRGKHAQLEILERERLLEQEISSRNRSQTDLNLYMALAKSSTEFIGMCDIKGVPFFINDAGLRLVGLDSLEQGLKTPVREFFFPEDQTFISEEFFPTVLQNDRAEIEIRFRHFKTGEALWMIYNVFSLKDVENHNIGFGTVSTNITGQKKIEAALRMSQKDLQHAQSVACFGSWRINIPDNTLEWSDETCRIFGVPQGMRLTYETFLDKVHPEDRASVTAAWENTLLGKQYDLCHRIVVENKIKWIHGQGELEYDNQGRQLLSGFGTVVDVSESKFIEEALHHERAFLRQIIDATPSMIFVKDHYGRFVLGNWSLAKCYGTSPESLLGMTDAELNRNADEVAHFHEDDLEVIDTGNAKLIPEEKVTHADGGEHWYKTVKIPLFNSQGVCDKLLGVATEITERKQAEEALRQADRHKDEFLAMLAHELRNPMAPILSAVQWLERQEIADPKQLWACGMIGRQVNHMIRLLDDLLEVSRIMQGKIRLEIEYLDIRDVVNHAMETVRPLADTRGQEFVLTMADISLGLEGDRVRLSQVLSNLLNNAVKYSNQGDKIYLNVSRQNANAVIEVRDSGIGIAPEVLPRIFDLFKQADHSLAHANGGLGIGLTLVKILVEKHGGSVTAASDGLGLGSLFTVRLPVLPEASAVNVCYPAELPSPLTKSRILIVDDYSDAAWSLMLLLQTEGYQVETANTGLEAIEKARIFCPLVVLIDIGMPDLDGFEVAKRLRALPETRDAILFALTGYGQSKDRKCSQLAGFNHHFLKPLNIKDFKSILAAYAKGR